VLDLNEVLAELDKMIRRLIGEDIALAFHPGNDLGSVRADRGQIEQVVLNLAVNARDAMPKGGQLTIETADVELDADYAQTHVDATPGPHVMIAVSDSGIGMDPDTLQRAFEPFFTTKDRGKGTGLGLATCHGIVRQSGGHITVYSELGHGTVFKVYLPRVDEPTRVARVTSAAPASTGNETILLIEDDPAVRAGIVRILSARNYGLLVACSGDEAIALARSHAGTIELILSDTILPGMNGIEAVREILDRHAEARVLFMSGYTNHALLGEIRDQDRTGFIQKPFGQEALASKVRLLLDRARDVAPLSA